MNSKLSFFDDLIVKSSSKVLHDIAKELDTFMATQHGVEEHAKYHDFSMIKCEDCYVVCIDVPGIKKKHLELTVEDGVNNNDRFLVITGERYDNIIPSTAEYIIHRYSSTGRFRKQVSLPLDADTLSTIHANITDGVLSVTIPRLKKEYNARVKNIPIS
jgi:HSP20 family molecular chaperone IbpA